MTNNKTDKVQTKSADINVEEIKKLSAVFPQFVADGKIDFDAMKAWFEKEKLTDNYEKFGLRFAGKQEAFEAIRRPSVGTLVADKEQSVDWDNTQNIFIEGENLEVLKLLQAHYREKIKMIYIDPPYNTGKDFVYKDNFTEDKSDYYERTGQTQDGIKMVSNPESSGRYHSDWLTMMYPRLFLAKNLLREDGVLFVSIDDHEVAHLRMIMDEICGEENFICQIAWKKGSGTQNDNKYIPVSHEYIMIYAKQKDEKLKFYNLKPTQEMLRAYKYTDKHVETRGKHTLRNMHDESIGDRPGLHYDIMCPDGTILKGSEHQWRCDEKRYRWRLSEDRLVFEKNKSGTWQVFYKQYINEQKEELIYDNMGNLLSYGKKPDSLLLDLASTGDGKKDLNDLFTNNPFDYPKPLSLIKHLLSISVKNSDVVLDFFAGSGTTAHAMMDLNAEDGGSRRYICVQLPEATSEDSEAYKAGYKNIAQIARERIRRAGAKIAKGDIGFKAYKLAPSHYRQWQSIQAEDTTPEKYVEIVKLFTEKPLVDDYVEGDVVTEIILKEGLDLHACIKKNKIGKIDLYTAQDGDKKVHVTFAKNITYEEVAKLDIKQGEVFVCLDSALTDTDKVNIARIAELKTI